MALILYSKPFRLLMQIVYSGLLWKAILVHRTQNIASGFEMAVDFGFSFLLFSLHMSSKALVNPRGRFEIQEVEPNTNYDHLIFPCIAKSQEGQKIYIRKGKIRWGCGKWTGSYLFVRFYGFYGYIKPGQIQSTDYGLKILTCVKYLIQCMYHYCRKFCMQV